MSLSTVVTTVETTVVTTVVTTDVTTVVTTDVPTDDDDDDDDDIFSASPVLFEPDPSQATSMLIVDRDVDPSGLLATAAKPNVVIVDFDDDEDSTEHG